jgi:DNA-binding GntR family transcriptional regulator
VTATRAKRPGSLTDQVRQWFRDNPGEELTYADMAVKFGLQEKPLYAVISVLKAERLVEVVHVVKGLPVGGAK